MKLRNLSKRYLALALSVIILMTATSLNMLLAGAAGKGEPEVFSVQFNPYSNSLGDSFLTSWNHEGNYQSSLAFTALFEKGWGDYTQRKYSDSYAYRLDNEGEIYSRIAGITPIDGNGNTPELTNFELTFDYRVPINTKNSCGAVWVGFRQNEAGRFTTKPWTYNKEQSVARITNTGITVASGSDLNEDIAKEDEKMSSENTAWLAVDGKLVTVKVKVVGNNCEVGVYKKETNEALLTYSETLDSTALQSGYLTLGIADRQINMINLTVKRLDEEGNVIDFTDNTKRPEAVKIVEVYKTVEIGTEFESIGLPAAVSVIDENEKTHQCNVTWNSEG